jgi:UDP-N-acetylglucosamine acyltransferase
MGRIRDMPGAVIHPTAIVSPKAEIGEGAVIGPYAVIDEGASVGAGSVIEAFARLTRWAEIGRGVHIFEHAVLGTPPQDHDFGGEKSYVRVEDDVIIRENVTIHRATGEGRETRIGRGTMLMEGCHVGHNVRVGEFCTITNKTGLSGHVWMGDYVVVGGHAGFHQFVRVGSYAMVGGMARIVKDVPPYSMVAGNPAYMAGLNTVGLRRRGFDQEQRTRIKRIYRMLFDGRHGMNEALANIGERFPEDGFAEEIASFARGSRRGLYQMRGRALRREDGE